MRFLQTLTTAGFLAAVAVAPVAAADISGAGATFPYPIYAKWADAYKKETGIGLNYQSIGSGGGIKQIQNKTVTFGATDAPLKGEQLEKIGLIQFPMVMGGIVPVINLEGIKPGELTLDGPTLANIFLGKIKTWNDPAIQKLNPSAKLPAQAIVVVHRSDGSGTTYNFAYYLSEISPEWKSKVSYNTSVEWPVGIGAKGNEGVANNVAQTKGSIGYVEYAYAKQNKLTHTKMINKDGKTVDATSANFQAAAANAKWDSVPGYGVILANQPGDAVVADDRGNLDPDVQEAAERRRQHLPRSSSSPGRTRRATRWPTTSTTSRCRPTSSPASRRPGQAEVKDGSGKPLFTQLTLIARRKAPASAPFSRLSCADAFLRSERARVRLSLVAASPGRRASSCGTLRWNHAMTDAVLPGHALPADAVASRARAISRMRLGDILFRALTRTCCDRRPASAGRRDWCRWSIGALAGPARIRLRVSDLAELESGDREVRRAGADLRHDRHLADRDADRGADRPLDRDVPDRALPDVPAAADRHCDRTARRHPEHHLRHLGPVRVRARSCRTPCSRS